MATTSWTQAEYFERQEIEAELQFKKEPSRSPGENAELTALDGQYRLGPFLFNAVDFTLAAIHFADSVNYEKPFQVCGRTMTMLEGHALVTAAIVDPFHKSQKWIRNLNLSLDNGDYYG